MFFPERIRSIKPTDRVLEIGPGGSPHTRADVLLDYDFKSQEMAASQRGYAAELKTDKPILYYQGDTFPLEDQAFDYVICSHVAEHVPNLERFIAELTRVGKAGYLEYPTIYYDYLYNFPVHTTFLKQKGTTLYWMSKADTNLAAFQLVQDFFYQSLVQQHWDLVDQLKEFFFEGFEWSGSIQTAQTSNLQDLVFDNLTLPPYRKKSGLSHIRHFLRSRLLSNV